MHSLLLSKTGHLTFLLVCIFLSLPGRCNYLPLLHTSHLVPESDLALLILTSKGSLNQGNLHCTHQSTLLKILIRGRISLLHLGNSPGYLMDFKRKLISQLCDSFPTQFGNLVAQKADGVDCTRLTGELKGSTTKPKSFHQNLCWSTWIFRLKYYQDIHASLLSACSSWWPRRQKYSCRFLLT